MFIISVIPLKKGVPFDTLSYYWPEELTAGTLVKLSLSNRPTIGIVEKSISVLDEKTTIRNAPFRLKKLTGVVGHAPMLTALLQAIIQTQPRVLAPLSSMCATVIAPEIGEFKFSILPSGQKEELSQIVKDTSFVINETNTRYEEYKVLMRSFLAKGSSVVFLAPTIKDTEAIHAYLSKGISQKVHLIHQKISLAMMKSVTARIATPNTPCAVVMTARYLGVTPSKTAAIIIEKSSSDFYRGSDRFRIDTRLITKSFTQKIGATLIYGDTLPSFEQLAESESLSPLRSLPLQQITTVEPETNKKESLFPLSITTLIASTLSEKRNIWIFAHRKGIAPLSRCKDCGTIVSCIDCVFPMLLKREKDTDMYYYVCNHCGRTENANTPCRHCKSWNIFPQRIGSDAVVEYCARQFPQATVLLQESVVKTISQKKKKESDTSPKIYIGTEAILPYTEDLSIAIIPFFDRIYATPSYETNERLIRTLLLAREYAKDGIYVVTKHPEVDLLTAFGHGTLRTIIGNELELRKTLHFPPYGTLLRLTITARAAAWPDAGVVTQTILTALSITATGLPLVRTALSSMHAEKSWILHVDDTWLLQHGEKLIAALEESSLRYTIERTPHYFL